MKALRFGDKFICGEGKMFMDMLIHGNAMKKFKWMMILLSTVLVLSACSSNTAATGATSGVGNASASTTSVAAKGVPVAPTRTAELYGQVKSIIGNEVVLLLAEQTTTTETLTDAQKEAKKAEMQALSAEERAKVKNEAIKFTGKSATITIPVGTPITSAVSSTDKEVLKELTLTDIRGGIFLKIWTEEGGTGDAKSAEYVRVMQSQ